MGSAVRVGRYLPALISRIKREERETGYVHELSA